MKYTSTLAVIQFLIELYPASTAIVDGNDMLAIHHACLDARQENLPAIQTLVQAYPRGLKVENNLCLTPIFVASQHAARNENVPVIRYLAEACPKSVSRLNGFGITVLHWYFSCLYNANVSSCRNASQCKSQHTWNQGCENRIYSVSSCLCKNLVICPSFASWQRNVQKCWSLTVTTK